MSGCAQLLPTATPLNQDTNALLEEQLHDGEIANWHLANEPDLKRNLAVFLTCTEEKKLCRYYYTVLEKHGQAQPQVFGRTCRKYKGMWEPIVWQVSDNPAMHKTIRARYFELNAMNTHAPPAGYVSDYRLPTLLQTNMTRAERKHRMPFADMIDTASKKNRIHPVLIHAVVNTESAYNPHVRSHVGAIGLMQLMPGTADDLRVDPYKPKQNLDGGSRYLRQQLDRPGIKGNVALALAAYNAGYGNVKKYGYAVPPYSETRNYVKKIMTLYSSK